MTPATHGPIPFRVKLRRQSAIISRWLHLYLSMVSFGVVLFFAVTMVKGPGVLVRPM